MGVVCAKLKEVKDYWGMGGTGPYACSTMGDFGCVYRQACPLCHLRILDAGLTGPTQRATRMLSALSELDCRSVAALSVTPRATLRMQVHPESFLFECFGFRCSISKSNSHRVIAWHARQLIHDFT